MTRPGKITKFALGHLFQKPATIVKPEDGPGIQKNYRGKIAYDPTNCINCRMCQRDCPAKAITVVNEGTKEEKKMKIIYDEGRCIFCAQCVDTCPKNCLSFTQNIYLAGFKREDLTRPL